MGITRGLANKLRAKHLENYDLLEIPIAAANTSEISEKLRAGRLKFDSELSVGQEARQDESRAGPSRSSRRAEGDSRRPSAPLPSPPAQGFHQKRPGRGSQVSWTTSCGSSGHGRIMLSISIKTLRKYLVREMSKVMEWARNPTEAWLLLESHFDRQMALIDGFVSQLLDSDTQILTYYNKVLRAIREAKELERLQDFLTPNQIETLLTVLPKKEVCYWRLEQMKCAGIVFECRSSKDLPGHAASAKCSLGGPLCAG